MARIPPIDPSTFDGDAELLKTKMDADALGEEYADLFSSRLRNVHRTIATNPGVLRAFRGFMAGVREATDLTARQRELIILAAAAGAEARYEWHQHVRHGLAAGLSEEEMRAIGAGEFDAFGDDEAALLAYVDAYVRGEMSDDHHAALAERFDPEDLVAIGMLAGGYLALARALKAFGVELEEPFVGWELENV